MNEELKKALELISGSKDVKEVQTELSKIVPPVTPKDAFALLEKDEEGKIMLNSFADNRVTAGIATAITNFKKKELKEEVTKAVKEKEDELTKKFNPTMSEEAKKIIELEKKHEELERKSKLSESKAAVTAFFAKEKVDTSFIGHFVEEDLDASLVAAEGFVKKFQQAVSAESEVAIKQKFKELKFDPEKKNDTSGGDTGPISQKDVDAAYNKAKELGTNEARAEYSITKKKYEFQQQSDN